MQKIRILIVDDSVVIRRMLTDILSQEPGVEVVGSAANGKIALMKLSQVNPDLVTLDVEMPEMDGLETLPHLRKAYPKLPVIMFSTLTERGAAATLDALTRGATDYVAKPANVGSVSAGIQSVRDQLVPKIRALCPLPSTVAGAGLKPTMLRKPVAATRQSRPTRVDAVCIGCSTGGPQALGALLRSLPSNHPTPIAVVQHMPPVFTQHLAQRLDQDCAIKVREARDGDRLEAGLALIAPGDYHMTLVRQGTSVVAKLTQQPPENSCRPAVDVLFRTAAAAYGAGCLGVVLTGMGQDGLRGSEAVVHAGGNVLTQDQSTSVVWGMPRAVAEAGLARSVLPLAELAPEIKKLIAVGRSVGALC